MRYTVFVVFSMTYGAPSGPTTSAVRFAFGIDLSNANSVLVGTVVIL